MIGEMESDMVLENVDILDDLIFYCSDVSKDCSTLRKNRGHGTEISMKEENMKICKKESDLDYEHFLSEMGKQLMLDSDLVTYLEIIVSQKDIDSDYEKYFKTIKGDEQSHSIELTDSNGVRKLRRYKKEKNFHRKAKNARKFGKSEMWRKKKESKSTETVSENSRKQKVAGQGEKAIELDDIIVKEEVEDDYANSGHTPASKGGEIVSHWKDNESSEVVIIDPENIAAHEIGYSPFVPSKYCVTLSAGERWEGGKDTDQSEYRKELMDLLKQPFDQVEFNDLWRVMTQRTPVQGSVNLRRTWKLYPTKTDGKSYLDSHEDLKQKIDAFRPDEHKIIYLLRGFFFWLKKTAHQGAFKPWLDSQFLEASEKGGFPS